MTTAALVKKTQRANEKRDLSVAFCVILRVPQTPARCPRQRLIDAAKTIKRLMKG